MEKCRGGTDFARITRCLEKCGEVLVKKAGEYSKVCGGYGQVDLADNDGKGSA